MMWLIMWRSVQFIVALVLCVGTGVATAWAIDMQSRSGGLKQPPLRFAFSGESPLGASPGMTESLQNGVPGAYFSAMTLYRVAMASGLRPPLVKPDRIYGEELAGPLQWTWSAENGDVITRVGKGTFRLSFEENRSNWFRELSCTMTQWPGGDLAAVISCEDGSERTMLIPSEGIVMLGNVAYQRIFQREPLPPEEDALVLEAEEGLPATE